MASYKLERRLFVLFALSFVCTIGLLLHLTFQLSSEQANSDPAPAGVDDLIEEMESIEATLTKEREQMKELSRNIDQRFEAHPRAQIHRNLPAAAAAKQQMIWSEPIPVLVLVCNRVEAVRESVKKLLRYRPSKEQFPIVVSQDCDNRALQSAVREEFGDEVQYIKHLSAETVRLKVPAEQRKFAVYYKISRHYRLALNHVFEKQNFSSAIITEDDLDIAADFFDYFLATRSLLETDPSLFCVSAWNDNGKPGLIDPNGTTELHRTDFFPGLGWMMTRNLWLEIGPKWPAGFWDDFVREPEQRRDRSCIRPEISRTSMTAYGRSGASKGLFFNRHLRRIVLNQVPVQFTKMSLEFLRKPAYDAAFLQRIQSMPKISVEELIQLRRGNGSSPAEFRVPYESMDQFVVIAQRIGIMADTKAGVPRTAYLGVVSCFFNGVRLHIAPADLAQWRGYDRHWQAPQAVLDGLD